MRLRLQCVPVAIGLAALPGCGLGGRAASPDPAGHVVPVYREPMHRLVFHSPLVRVMDVRIPPGDTTGFHVHADRLVGIVVQDARTWAQALGMPPGDIAARRTTPATFDNWSQTLPYTHRVANVDTVPLHYVVAEWLARSGSAAPALPDGPDRRLVSEGAAVRVYEITLSPGGATEPHHHATPGLSVLGTPGDLSEEGRSDHRGGSGPGSWSWRDGPGNHVLRNAGATRLIVYEIDWR